jgi:hypothetical protein
MNRYDIALLVTIEAESYREALREASKLADGIADSDNIPVSAVMSYDIDNENQRILYLSPVKD